MGSLKAFELEKAIKEGLFTLIIDNFDVYDEVALEQFSAHVKMFDENRWIVLATPPVDSVSKDRLFNEALPEFLKLHIRPLRRKGIRQLAKHWAQGRKDSADQAFNAVINQLNHDGLPRTPYMVSLLLWAMHQRKEQERINEAMLLENVIDHLLGKADFRQAKRGTLNPKGKEISLQELAIYFREKGDYSLENDVLEFLITFFKRKRLPFTASDVLEKLISCGVMHRSGDTISFKYKCFQEYFIATRFRDNAADLNRYLCDLEFLKVRRELELLSGLRHQNSDLISFIQQVLGSRVPEKFVKSDASQFTRLASKGLDRVTTQAKLREIRRTRLTDEELDAIMDEADRRAIARGDRPISQSLEEAHGDVFEAARARQVEAIEADSAADGEPLRPGTHMAAIDLLARVVRNSDFTDYDEKGPAAKLVLKSWIKILVVMLGEAQEVIADLEKSRDEKLTKDEKALVIYLLSKFLFGLIGDNIVEQMSSPTMADTLIDLLEEDDMQTGEKMLVLFLLEDAKSENWQTRWTSLIDENAASGFVLEGFIERLWLVVHRKALDEDQSRRVNQVVDRLEKKLGWTKDKKSAVLQSIRQATNVRRLEEGR